MIITICGLIWAKIHEASSWLWFLMTSDIHSEISRNTVGSSSMERSADQVPAACVLPGLCGAACRLHTLRTEQFSSVSLCFPPVAATPRCRHCVQQPYYDILQTTVIYILTLIPTPSTLWRIVSSFGGSSAEWDSLVCTCDSDVMVRVIISDLKAVCVSGDYGGS